MAGLKPEIRDGVWYAVGTFNGKRIRKSLRTRVEETAKEQCALYEAKLWKRHSYGEEAVRTFEEAALSYMQQGGEARYLPKLLKHFKGRALGSIKPAEIRDAALVLYPKDKPSTRNRQCISPARAVINHGHDRGWCGHIKVKAFDVPKSRKNKPVDRAWIDAFMAEADRRSLYHLSACVLFMHQTGARVSEAINLMGEHVDLSTRSVLLAKTKTEEWVPRYLTAEMVARIASLSPTEGRRVFYYTSRQAVNRRIKAMCEHIGIEVRSTHAAGRHSFATNAMNGGARVKDAMEAGGWKSAALFMQTYVHSDEAGRNVAGIFDRETGLIDTNLPQAKIPRLVKFGKQTRK